MALNGSTPAEVLDERRARGRATHAHVQTRAPAHPNARPEAAVDLDLLPQSPGSSNPDPRPVPGPDLRRPLPPAPVDGVLELLAPVLGRPLDVVEQSPLPAAADLTALHRAELEADFAALPPLRAGSEPPIPARFAPGTPVLPHIEFPP